MKKSSLTGFQKYLIGEALDKYNDLISKEEFPKNSIITKEYLQSEIEQLLTILNLSKKTK
jgi:hypothetical protein